MPINDIHVKPFCYSPIEIDDEELASLSPLEAITLFLGKQHAAWCVAYDLCGGSGPDGPHFQYWGTSDDLGPMIARCAPPPQPPREYPIGARVRNKATGDHGTVEDRPRMPGGRAAVSVRWDNQSLGILEPEEIEPEGP